MRAAEMALTSEQRATLQSWLAAGKTEQRLAFRAEIILALDEGLSNQAVAERLATRARRQSANGVAGLRSTAWPGWPMRRAAASRSTTMPTMRGGSSRPGMRRR